MNIVARPKFPILKPKASCKLSRHPLCLKSNIQNSEHTDTTTNNFSICFMQLVQCNWLVIIDQKVYQCFILFIFFFYSSVHNNRYLRISIRSTSAAEGSDNIDETPVVLETTFGTASFLLFLLLLFDLGRLSLDFTRTGQ